MSDDPWKHAFSDSDAQQEIAHQVQQGFWQAGLEWLKSLGSSGECCGFGTCAGCPNRGKYRRS